MLCLNDRFMPSSSNLHLRASSPALKGRMDTDNPPCTLPCMDQRACVFYNQLKSR